MLKVARVSRGKIPLEFDDLTKERLLALDYAKRIFLESYYRSKVILSPMSAVDDSELDHKGFKVLRLT
jgi:hypothetical protein